MAETALDEARRLHRSIMRVRAELPNLVAVEVEQRLLAADLAELDRLIADWLAVASDVHTPPEACVTAELHAAELHKHADSVRYRLAVLKRECVP
jgi:hypothetical protein